MASPLVRRQIVIPIPLGSSTTSQTPPQTTPSPAVPNTSTPNGSLPPSTVSGISSVHSGSVLSTTSSVAHLTSSIPSSTSSSSSVPPVSPTNPPPVPTSQPDGPTTITQTSSATDPPSSGSAVAAGAKGNSFLENKALSGSVFGLAALLCLILAVIAITSFMRRRNRKRLLADASTFSFDPKAVEDGVSDEKYSHSGHGHHTIGHGHNDYLLDNRIPVGAAGGISRPVPVHSPPISNYIPQEYTGGYDGGYQYRNMGNVPAGYNPTPNPYDMYSPRTGGGYQNGRVQHDPYNPSGPNGDNNSRTDSGHFVPRQLQPGIHNAHGLSPALNLSNRGSPPLNYAPPISSTTSPQPPSHLQRSASDPKEPARLPTPDFPPGTPGLRDSVGSADDAYDGAFLGPESPPGPRTLQVANM